MVLNSATGAITRTIALQYNPDTLTRSYQVQGVGGEGGGERAQPFRLKGPAIESIKLDAEIDATDALEHPDQNANAVKYGIAPQLAVARSAGQSDHRGTADAELAVEFRNARNPAAGSAAGAVRLEREPRRARCASRNFRSRRKPSTRR